MRAIVTADYGSAPALVELATPIPGPGEVLVKVRSASLNGFDNALTNGYFRGVMEHQFPVVLGRDFAGTVDQVGPEVTDFSVGDQVFGVVITQPLSAGTFAEYVLVPQDHNIALIPAGLDHAIAGVIGLAGAAAVDSVNAIGPTPGETVLISGATGGVGAVAIQLVAARGATVIATATNPTEAEHVRALGATHVVDPGQDLDPQVRAVAPGGLDAVMHFAGDPQLLASLLVDGGRFTTLLSATPDQPEGRTISVIPVFAAPHRAVLDSLAAEVLAGRLRIPVQRSYDLAEVPKAFADFNAGTLGKLAVTID